MKKDTIPYIHKFIISARTSWFIYSIGGNTHAPASTWLGVYTIS